MNFTKQFVARAFAGHCLAISLALGASLAATAVHAEGTFISAGTRADIAYDDARGVLYISSGGRLLRYQLSTKSFLAPIYLGGELKGLDISPDGRTLAVANSQIDDAKNWIHLVDLSSLAVRKIKFTRIFDEGGTFSVAYTRDGRLLVSSSYFGWIGAPLRRYDPVSQSVMTVGSVHRDSMLRSSADGSVVALASNDTSSGAFGKYMVSSGTVREDGDTGWMNFDVGVSRDARFYAVSTYGGTYIAGKSLAPTGTVIGTYASGQPLGAAFHPTKDKVYFPWANSREVKVYSTKTWTQMGSHDFQTTFGWKGNEPFAQGRAKLSRDGSLLFVTVEGGVRFVQTK